MNRSMPLNINIPNSKMKDVNIGPKTVTGILYKKNTNPHKKQVIRAYGTPLDTLNNEEFFKSLKSSEIKTIPKRIDTIANNCMVDNVSPKKIIENNTVKMTEEFAIGDMIPTFPDCNAL